MLCAPATGNSTLNQVNNNIIISIMVISLCFCHYKYTNELLYYLNYCVDYLMMLNVLENYNIIANPLEVASPCLDLELTAWVLLCVREQYSGR